MQFLNRLYGWYGKRVVLGFLALVVLLVIIGVVFSLGSKPEPIEQADTTPTVTVRSVSEITSGSSFDVVGTVAAVDEARLQAEAGGRVTDVRVEIGDRVSAGTILATIESDSQYAALLQAEGAYESAQAAALSSGVGLETAKINVENLYRDSFTTADSIIRNTADQVISNPRGQSPGIRISASGRAPQLSEARVAIETMLEEWRRDIENNFSGLEEEEMLRRTERNLTLVSDFIADLSFHLASEKPSDTFTETELATLRASFASARASLDGTIASLTNTRREYEQAQIASGNNGITETNARLKSALGTLRSAQAAYEQTIVRSPIAGSVNALYLKEGTYVAPGTAAAVVANNGSLEISTSVGEAEGARITVGDRVRIENTADGVVTAIAPAIDPMTGKISVKIGVEDDSELENGSTVRVSFLMEASAEESDEILIPLTSLKITPQGSIVFEVGEDEKLKPITVTLGPVRGELVLVEEGLTSESRIVVDARGLKEGETVNVE